MNKKKRLIIINKEKIFLKNNIFYCDNIDMKTIPEELSKNFDLLVIATKSKIERFLEIDFKNIKVANNIFIFLLRIFQTFKKDQANYLLVSITPYNFFAFLFLFIFRKNIYIYLRSNGYEEYKAILGFLGPIIYHIMFTIVTSKSKIITCQERLVKKKGNYHLVFPSELKEEWLTNIKVPLINKPKLLYVGRVKIEKGIFSLIKILGESNSNISLSIAGNDETKKINNKNINLLGFQKDLSSLIKVYDDHNITILPSFTEAHPKVIDESLARIRPIIIFEEIEHIIQNKYGVFVAKRDAQSLLKTIEFIMKNYNNIQEKIKLNKLPTKKIFISEFTKILS